MLHTHASHGVTNNMGSFQATCVEQSLGIVNELVNRHPFVTLSGEGALTVPLQAKQNHLIFLCKTRTLYCTFVALQGTANMIELINNFVFIFSQEAYKDKILDQFYLQDAKTHNT